jgi:hypothetical protein
LLQRLSLFAVMRLSENSHRRLEDFFRFYLKNDAFKLPTVHFYTGKFTALLTRAINVNGITFGGKILIMPALVSLNRKNQKKLPDDLIVHEIMHVIQYANQGFIKFLYRYLKYYWINLRKTGEWNLAARRKAYLEIPFEIEAREAADEYLKWKEKQKRAVQ